MFGQAIEAINLLPAPWNIVVWCLLSLGAAGYVGSKTVFFVPQGHKAIKLRFKKVVYRDDSAVVVEPGIRFVIPFSHSLKIVSTMPHPVPLRTMSASLDKYTVVKVRATAVFDIVDVYLVAYGSDDFRIHLSSACENVLRSAMHTARSTDPDVVKDHFVNEILPTARALGVLFSELFITSVEPIGTVMIAESLRDPLTPSD